MEHYLVMIVLLAIASALLIGLFTLIEIHNSTKASVQGIQELLRVTKGSHQGIEELIRLSQEERRRSEATLKMAEATLRELLDLRQQSPQVH